MKVTSSNHEIFGIAGFCGKLESNKETYELVKLGKIDVYLHGKGYLASLSDI